jgi:sulfopyruvate decarboxylase TPP-binding subunit
METEQMIARLLAEIKSGQEHMKEMIEANQAKTDRQLKEMRSIVNAWIADMRGSRKETMPCQVMMGACLHSEELNLEDMESEVECREVPTEEAAVKSSGTMKKQHRG